MLKINYLSFNNKNRLTYKIGCFNFGGMSATEILLLSLGFVGFTVFRVLARSKAVKAERSGDARLKRIQIASCWIQVLIGISFILGVYWVLAFLYGWPMFSHDKVRVVISQGHIYSSPAEMPPVILAWWSVKMGLALFCNAVLFSLFRHYQKGVIFSATNVRHIHSLAYFLIANWLIDYQLQSTLHDMDLSTTPLFIGLLIIFVAWVMDEGRKIKEEQELTV